MVVLVPVVAVVLLVVVAVAVVVVVVVVVFVVASVLAGLVDSWFAAGPLFREKRWSRRFCFSLRSLFVPFF